RAVAAELPAERVVVDLEGVGRVLRPGPLVTGDAAGDALTRLVRRRRDEANRVTHAKARSVELDRAYPHIDQVARLADPGEPHDGGAGLAEEDLLERRPLRVVAALVEMEDDAPRRARLVVVVTDDERRGEPREVDLAEVPVVDAPREGAQADAVRRPAA